MHAYIHTYIHTYKHTYTHADRAVTTACGALADPDSNTLRAAWSAVLQAANNASAALWTEVNPRKTFWPAVWGLVRAGGRSQCTSVFRGLPALMGKVPADVVGQGRAFHAAFFTSAVEGLQSVPPTRADREVAVRGVVETCAVLLHSAVATDKGSLPGDDPVPFLADGVLLVLHASAIAGVIDTGSSLMLVGKLVLGFSPGSPRSAENPDGAHRVVNALWRSIGELAARALRTGETVKGLCTGGGEPVWCELAAPASRRQGGSSVAASLPSATAWVVDLVGVLVKEDSGDAVRVLGLVHRLCAAVVEPPALSIGAVVPLLALLEQHAGKPVFATPYNGGGNTSVGDGGGDAASHDNANSGTANDKSSHGDGTVTVTRLLEWLETAAVSASKSSSPSQATSSSRDPVPATQNSAAEHVVDSGGATPSDDTKAAVLTEGDDSEMTSPTVRAAAECTLLVLLSASVSGCLPAAAPLPRRLRRVFDR